MTTLKRSPQSGAWLARKAIPEAIRPAYAKLYGQGHEAKFSLPSYTPESKARTEFATWHALIESRFAFLRDQARGLGSDLTHKQAHALAGLWYRSFTAQHEANPGQAYQWARDKEHIRYVIAESQGAAGGFYEARIKAISQYAAGWWGLDAFLASHNVLLSAAGREAFYAAVSIEMEAAFDLLERRAEGDYTPDSRPVQHPRFIASEILVSELREPVAVPSDDPTPSSLFALYCEATTPAANTQRTWGTVFKNLDAYFASKIAVEGRTLETLSEEDAFAWRQSLRDLKKPGTDKLSMNETSVHKCYVSAARTVWAWALEERKLTRKDNPFAALKMRKDKRAALVRHRERSFKDGEVATILKATSADHGKRKYANARRWVPWLCAYNGARPGEMCQLRKEDVEKFEGTWFVGITPEAGTVKDREVRWVPVHEHLVAQGFIDFVKAAPAGPLFHDAEEGAARAAINRPTYEKALEDLGEWVRGLGVDDPEIRPNHAWRHTFKRKARAAGIEPGIRDAFCGHAARTAGEDYEALEGDEGKRVLAEAIKQFPRYSLD